MWDAQIGEALTRCRFLDRQQCFQQGGFSSLRSRGVGASDFALAGSSWTSRKSPSMPAATAARARSGNELRLAAAHAVGRRGLLHRVSTVENHGREAAHDGQGAKIHHQIVATQLDPRSVRKTRRCPWSGLFPGRGSCPTAPRTGLFLMLTARPVRPGGVTRSCRFACKETRASAERPRLRRQLRSAPDHARRSIPEAPRPLQCSRGCAYFHKAGAALFTLVRLALS